MTPKLIIGIVAACVITIGLLICFVLSGENTDKESIAISYQDESSKIEKILSSTTKERSEMPSPTVEERGELPSPTAEEPNKVPSSTAEEPNKAVIINENKDLNPEEIIKPTILETKTSEPPKVKFAQKKTNLIESEIEGFSDFIKEVEKYDLRANLDKYVGLLPDGEEKEKLKKYKDDVIDIINMNSFNLTRSSSNELKPEYLESKEEFFKQYYNKPFNKILNMKTLSLSNFKLKYLPIEALSFFKNVDKLYLSNTGLNTGFEDLAVLDNLYHLILSFNRITEFPDFSNFPSSLELIDLSHNHIKEIKTEPFKGETTGKCRKSSIEHLFLNANKPLKLKKDDNKVFIKIAIV